MNSTIHIDALHYIIIAYVLALLFYNPTYCLVKHTTGQ